MNSDDHIKPLRLFDIARGRDLGGLEPTEDEKKHLRDCTECDHIVRVFARQFNKPIPKSDDAA
jgi:hypothetical protein